MTAEDGALITRIRSTSGLCRDYALHCTVKEMKFHTHCVTEAIDPPVLMARHSTAELSSRAPPCTAADRSTPAANSP